MTDIQTIPVFRSPDLDVTSQYYAEQLGFVPERVLSDYLIVRRGSIELHFCPHDYETDRPTEQRCYIRGADIDAIHDDFVARGLNGFRQFERTAWNMFEFYVSDPFGLLLVFGRSATEGHPPASLK